MLSIDDDDDATDTPVPTTADSAAPPGPDGPTTITLELECALNDAEVQAHGEAMAADEREIDRLKTRRKSLNAQIRAKYDRMTELAQAIDSRREVRDIACTWRPDYQRKQWDLQRDDTQAVIRSRSMSAIDLQTRLPLDSVAASDAADVAADEGDDPDYVMQDVTSAPFGEDFGDGPYDADTDRDASDLLPARSTVDARAAMARPAGTHPNGLTEDEHAARATKPAKPAKPKPRARTASPAPAKHTNGKTPQAKRAR